MGVKYDWLKERIRGWVEETVHAGRRNTCKTLQPGRFSAQTVLFFQACRIYFPAESLRNGGRL